MGVNVAHDTNITVNSAEYVSSSVDVGMFQTSIIIVLNLSLTSVC